MDQRIINLYDRFTHGGLSRRDFLDRLAVLAGSAAAAQSVLALLASDYANAETIAADDPRLATGTLTYPSEDGPVKGYLARPKGGVRRPAVMVVHQNRGLNPHIRDMVRRFAVEGFLALGVDMLSPFGGTPDNDDQARDLFAKVSRNDPTIPVAGVSFLKTHAESTGHVGAVGFCFGGGMVDLTAMHSPDLDAAVAYYGPIPEDKSRVKDIRAPLLLHYAGLDDRVNAGIPAWEAALKANNKRYTIYMYPDVNHAFTDDSGVARYDKAAADLAWGRTLASLRDNLGTPPA